MKTNLGEWLFSKKNDELSTKIAYTLVIVTIIGLSVLTLLKAIR